MSLACLPSHANQGNDLLPGFRALPFAGFSQGAATAGPKANIKEPSAHGGHFVSSNMPFNPR